MSIKWGMDAHGLEQFSQDRDADPSNLNFAKTYLEYFYNRNNNVLYNSHGVVSMQLCRWSQGRKRRF